MGRPRYDISLIPLYGKHKHTAMNICHWLRQGCFTRTYQCFLPFRIVVMNPVFVTSDDMMKNTFSFVYVKQYFEYCFLTFYCSFYEIMWQSIFLLLKCIDG